MTIPSHSEVKVDAKGIEAFRLWYRLHTGKMLTRSNATKAVAAYLSARSLSEAPAAEPVVDWIAWNGTAEDDGPDDPNPPVPPMTVVEVRFWADGELVTRQGKAGEFIWRVNNKDPNASGWEKDGDIAFFRTLPPSSVEGALEVRVNIAAEAMWRSEVSGMPAASRARSEMLWVEQAAALRDRWCQLARAALSATPSAEQRGETPEGFVLVPKEPTEAMIEAAEQADEDAPLSDWGKFVGASDADKYRAMLAASPNGVTDHG